MSILDTDWLRLDNSLSITLHPIMFASTTHNNNAYSQLDKALRFILLKIRKMTCHMQTGSDITHWH